MYIKFEISSNFSWQILGRLLSCCPERPVYFIYAADQTQDTSSYLLQTRQDTCTLYFAQILVHESFWSGPFNAFIAAHWPLFGTLCYLRMLWTHVPNQAIRTKIIFYVDLLSCKIQGIPVNISGHSLGAQTCGFLGKSFKNLTSIIGLDPAGPIFED